MGYDVAVLRNIYVMGGAVTSTDGDKDAVVLVVDENADAKAALTVLDVSADLFGTDNDFRRRRVLRHAHRQRQAVRRHFLQRRRHRHRRGLALYGSGRTRRGGR
ncbi:MAG: hypothetical protein M5R36_16510 [Deltaproteobacteria bacterium]|nr:hypothetical protein [Deltaproteobacteria bacterium]